MMMLSLLVILAHADISSSVPAPCGPELVPFTRRLTCRGQAVDEVTGLRFGVAITVNAVYLEEKDDAGTVIRAFNDHRVELTRPVLKWFSSTRIHHFPEFWGPECRREGARVRCSGRGDHGAFDAVLDLTSRRMTGSYRDTEYPNPAYNHRLRFEAEHALECEEP